MPRMPAEAEQLLQPPPAAEPPVLRLRSHPQLARCGVQRGCQLPVRPPHGTRAAQLEQTQPALGDERCAAAGLTVGAQLVQPTLAPQYAG